MQFSGKLGQIVVWYSIRGWRAYWESLDPLLLSVRKIFNPPHTLAFKTLDRRNLFKPFLWTVYLEYIPPLNQQSLCVKISQQTGVIVTMDNSVFKINLHTKQDEVDDRMCAHPNGFLSYHITGNCTNKKLLLLSLRD